MFRRRKTSGAADAGGQGAALRKLALEVDPAALGLSASAGPAAWAVVMDTVMADGAWHCLAVLGDGTTSLYTSSSFGVIGAGTHPTVRRASDALMRTAQSQLDLFAPTAATGLPGVGQVAIRALTFAGHAVVVAPEDDLGHGRHPASPVFHAAHAVISELRKVTPE